MSTRNRLIIVCAAAAFGLPLLSGSDDSYFEQWARFAFTGAVVVAVVPIIEAWRKPEETAVGASQRVLMVSLSRADAYRRALEAVRSLKGVRVTRADAAAGVISARTGATLRSVGEQIEVTVTDISDGGARVDAQSRSKMGGFGAERHKNDENVSAIAHAVRQTNS
ncbi:MAG: hypothetical protein ACRDY7_02200 [Acidimicrobiia bacterium]